MKTNIILLFSLLIFIGCDPIQQTIKKELLTRHGLTFSDFQKNLKADMNYSSITATFGEPVKDIGSGIHIYVYKLADSTEIWIGFTDKIIYARHLDSDRVVLDTLL